MRQYLWSKSIRNYSEHWNNLISNHKKLIFTNFQYEEDTNYEQLVWDLTKPGFKNWAKQNFQYLEMLKHEKKGPDDKGRVN